MALCSYNKHVHFLNLNFAHLSNNNNNSLHIRTLRLILHLIQVITLTRSRILLILASWKVCLMQKCSVHLFYIPIEVIMNKYYQCQVLEHTHVNNINNNGSNNNNVTYYTGCIQRMEIENALRPKYQIVRQLFSCGFISSLQ